MLARGDSRISLNNLSRIWIHANGYEQKQFEFLISTAWSSRDQKKFSNLTSYLDELNESDKKTPRMRPIDNQALQQYSCYLLLYNFLKDTIT